MTKTQKIYTEMITRNQAIFDSFKKLHDQYEKDPKGYKQQFNTYGSEILDIIRDYENRLCGTSENGGYGKFTTNLSEKFWSEIRKAFPKIDEVGIL